METACVTTLFLFYLLSKKCGDKRFSRKAPDMQSCSDDDHDSNAVPNFITARQQLVSPFIYQSIELMLMIMSENSK